MFCKNCGSQMDESARFCPKCGANLGPKTDHVPPPSGVLPGGLHRFCISALIVWTAFWAGLTFSVVGSLGQQARESTGATIGSGLGLGFYALFWFLPSVVLGIVAIAAKPPQPVVCPRSTKWLTVALVTFFFFGPQLSHFVSTSSETKPQSGASGQGEKSRTWRLLESKSDMDGSLGVSLNLDADNNIQGWLKSKTPTLVIRCKEGKTDTYIVSSMPANPEYGSLGTYEVRIRIDDQPPIRQEWTESTDQGALFAPAPMELAKLLASADVFVFEFTPLKSSPVTAHFNVHGLDTLLEKVAVPCSWGQAQEAAAARQQRAKEEERKAREIAHEKQWRLHVNVKLVDQNSVVIIHYSSDGGAESEAVLAEGVTHIDANDQVRIEVERAEEPSRLTVTLNGSVVPESKWTALPDPTFSSLNSKLGTKYVLLIKP